MLDCNLLIAYVATEIGVAGVQAMCTVCNDERSLKFCSFAVFIIQGSQAAPFRIKMIEGFRVFSNIR